MSLKEDIQAVKAELDAEEKFLESQVKAERFFKKYKPMFMAVGAGLIIAGIGMGGWTAWKDYRNEQANKALMILLSNPADKEALATLHATNDNLAAAFDLSRAMAGKDTKTLDTIAARKVDVVSDIAAYQSASLQGNEQKLSQYGALGDGIYRDLAVLTTAKIALERNETKKASQLLSRIPMTSPLKEFSAYLEHYTIKGI